MSSDHQTLDYKEEENKPKIPDNDRAKIMYYLECVFKLFAHTIQKRYTNYNNYFLISKLEERTILATAYIIQN